MTRIFNFTDDEFDDNIHAFLLTHFDDYEKSGYVFDQKTAKPFAKLIYDSGDKEILFYELTDGRLAWYDSFCGELVVTEKPMDVAEIFLELKKLVR